MIRKNNNGELREQKLSFLPRYFGKLLYISSRA